MDKSSSFRPSGNQILIVAPTTSPPTGVRLPGTSGQGGDVTILVWNPGTNPGWLSYGATAAEAASNAVVPSNSTGTKTLPVPPNSLQTFTMVPGSFYSAIATGGSQNLFVTPGTGV